MQSITTLNLNLQFPNYATTMHAVQNDKLTRKITAILFDGSVPFVPDENALGMVRFHKPDDTNGFYDTDEDGNTAVTWEGNVATISIAEQAISCPGIVLCQIQFYKENGERLTTFTWKIDVQECALTDEEIISTDYYSILSAQISAAMSITYRPPYINTTTGHWMTWSAVTNQYEDSGYSAQGTKGDKGDPGVSISSVTKKSGSGAAGTTDTYDVNLDNGQVAGTFDVYNGTNGQAGASMTGIRKISGTGAGGTKDTYEVELSNGQTGGQFEVYNGNDGTGAAGSALPLMDGTAYAGNANAYSREDHVHPKDSTKVDVVAGKGLSTNDFTDSDKTKLDGIAEGATANTAAASAPLMDGAANVGLSDAYAREDHVHPVDTSRQAKNVYYNSFAPECAITTWTLQSTPTIPGFPYRADIYIAGVTASMYAIVAYAAQQVLSGNYAPVCGTHGNGIYLYSKVNESINLESIAIFP